MIPWASPHYWGNEREYVLKALDSSWISGGPFVDRLEKEFSERCGSKFAIAVSNGTSALHLAFLGLGLHAGDEVIVPGFAFQAAANVALHMGLVPVFAEVDEDTWCLDAASVEQKITSRTRAIVAVHTYGNACDMREIMSVGNSNGIPVVEDAAEAIGTMYYWSPSNIHWVGTYGKIGTYSFHATKTIATGEGGMVVTDDESMALLMRTYRSHGMGKKRYWHEVPGHNFRMPNMAAAIGCGQIEYSDIIFNERKEIHSRYLDILDGERGVKPQLFTDGVDPIPWTFACMLDEDLFGPRDLVMEKMYEAGIETRPGFYPASVQPIYGCGPLPVCEEVASRVISMPGSPPSDDLDVVKICSALLSLRKG